MYSSAPLNDSNITGRPNLNNGIHTNPITAGYVMIALSDIFPEQTYGAVPVIDRIEAVEEYLARDRRIAQTFNNRRFAFHGVG
jgi:hypothetical protein